MSLSTERPFLGPLNLIAEARIVAAGSELHLPQGPCHEGRDEHWDWYYEVVQDAWPKVLMTLKEFLEK